MMSKELEAKAIKKAIVILDAIGCKYSIVTKDGDVHGSVNKRKFKYGYGVLRDHIAPYIKDIQPGEVRIVPIEGFDYASVQSSLSSTMHFKYGADSYMTSQVNDKNAVELMFFGSTKDDENEQSNP